MKPRNFYNELHSFQFCSFYMIGVKNTFNFRISFLDLLLEFICIFLSFQLHSMQLSLISLLCLLLYHFPFFLVFPPFVLCMLQLSLRIEKISSQFIFLQVHYSSKFFNILCLWIIHNYLFFLFFKLFPINLYGFSFK